MQKNKYEHINIVGDENRKSGITLYVMVGGLVCAAILLFMVLA